MNPTGKIDALLRNVRLNAALSWALVLGIGILGGSSLLAGDIFWTGFAFLVIAIAVVPPVLFRRSSVMLPWEVLWLVMLPLLGRLLTPSGPIPLLISHLSIAALALVIAVELHVFTAVRMNEWFAVSFVVIITLATAGLWAVVQWVTDEVLGTLFIPNLQYLMLHFTGATVAGFGSALLFTLYFRRITALSQRCCPDIRPLYTRTESTQCPVRFRDRLGVSEHQERLVVRLLQVILLGIFVIGSVRGDTSVIVNSALGFGVTLLPALLERDYDLSMDSGLVLWISTAVVVHAVGALGPYQSIWLWDKIAHTLSSSVVAAIGYTTVRAVSEHTSDVWIPSRLMFVFILLFVLAAGVFWEVLEFLAGQLAVIIGSEGVLIQYGLTDTMLDLVFDTVGGLNVAIWGTAYLTGTTSELTSWLDGRW